MIEAPQDPVGDNAGFVWSALLNGKSVDALAVANALRPLLGNDAALDGSAQLLVLPEDSCQRSATVATAWMQWLDSLAVSGDTPGASPYWNAHRLEYSFGLQADGTQPLIRLEADEYTDGKLDWHTFSLSAAQVQAKPNAEVDCRGAEAPANADHRPLSRHAVRSLLGVRGRARQLRHDGRGQDRPGSVSR